jgi:flagellar biosynthetic protein FliQ
VNDTAVVQAMILAAKLCAPILLTALAIGFAVSLLQTMTQIQEVTLSFVPKMIGVGIALVVSGSWMLHEIISFTNDLFASLPALLR